MTHYVLILAGGSGNRLNKTIPKQFLYLDGIPLLMHSVKSFYDADPKSKIYIGLPDEHIREWSSVCNKHQFTIPHQIYSGGDERIDTVFEGLKKLKKLELNPHDIVSIHDAARPFIDKKFILELMGHVTKHDVVVPILPIKNSIRKLNSNSFSRQSQVVDRSQYQQVQTPQLFNLYKLINCYEKIYLNSSGLNKRKSLKSIFFDDASIYDFFNNDDSNNLKLIPGKDFNIKITTPLDYFLAPRIYEFFKKQA